ncbi:hypothetical protein [Cupriavidus pampae]|uniref:hypothetical protein n=1 Tax=Cupriavidus pampae TaxID=659251 RepID=UPI001CC76400|nr:hypothetical protein [Cupriavidus pampae]
MTDIEWRLFGARCVGVLHCQGDWIFQLKLCRNVSLGDTGGDADGGTSLDKRGNEE